MRVRGLNRGLRRGSDAPVWTPRRNWPSAATPGLWYSPGEFSTMFQDSAGATQATAVEQPAGLALDKRLGLVLGVERIPNSNFSEGTNPFSLSTYAGTSAIVGGQLQVTAASAYSGVRMPASNLTANTWIYVEATLVSGTGRFTLEFPADEGVLANVDRTGPYTFKGYARVRSDGYFQPTLRTSVSGQMTVWDNISVRELHGNHSTQPSAPARPRISALVNRLAKTRDFSDPIWGKSEISVNSTATAGEFRIVASTANSVHSVYQVAPASYNLPYMSLEVKADGARYIAIGNSDQSAKFSSFDLQTGAPGFNSHMGKIDALGDGWYRIICKPYGDNSNNASSAWQIRIVNDLVSNPNTSTFAGDGVSGVIIRKPQYQPVLGSVATVAHPRYQWVNTATDYDTVGFPQYMSLDGLDDSLGTGAISLGASMDLFIAVRRTSATGALFFPTTGGAQYLGAMDATAGATSSGAGTPTYFVNGVAVPGGTATTRAQLASAIPVGGWCVVEIRDANLSAWASLGFGAYAALPLGAGIGEIIACPAGDDATRAKNRRWVGAKVGLSL